MPVARRQNGGGGSPERGKLGGSFVGDAQRRNLRRIDALTREAPAHRGADRGAGEQDTVPLGGGAVLLPGAPAQAIEPRPTAAMHRAARSACRRRSKSAVSIALIKVAATCDRSQASPGVNAPSATAAVTAPSAAARSAGLSIGGSAKFTVRSRRGARMRSRQSLSARSLPSSARSTAFCVSASDWPSSRHFGDQRRQVAAAAPAPGRVAGLPFFERPPAASGDVMRFQTCAPLSLCPPAATAAAGSGRSFGRRVISCDYGNITVVGRLGQIRDGPGRPLLLLNGPSRRAVQAPALSNSVLHENLLFFRSDWCLHDHRRDSPSLDKVGENRSLSFLEYRRCQTSIRHFGSGQRA